MTLVEKSLDQMMDEISFTYVALAESWIPERNPESYCVRNVPEYGVYVNLSPRYLERILTAIPSETEIVPDHLLRTVVAQVMENSLTRSHNTDLSLPISVKILAGENGCIIRIRDSGNGFDHQQALQQLRTGGSPQYQGTGMGLLVF